MLGEKRFATEVESDLVARLPQERKSRADERVREAIFSSYAFQNLYQSFKVFLL